MNYPKYVRTFDGYIGTFQYLDIGEFPVYRFPGGDRIADDWEIANGRDDRDFPPIIVYSLNQNGCLLYTSDAADELDGVDLGGGRVR